MSAETHPAAPPRVSAIVVSYNAGEDLLRCLASLERETIPLEVLVVDNASTDDSVEAVRREFPQARVIEAGSNRGFAAANNLGLAAMRSPYALLLNSDAELLPGALVTLVARLDARSEVGIVGPRTLNSDHTVQLSFGPQLTPLSEWRQRRLVRALARGDTRALSHLERQTRHEAEPFWVSGSCMLARRQALEAVGSFDESFFLYEEDVDLCLRVRQAGWQVLFTPDAEIVHHQGRSVRTSPSRAELEYHRSHLRYYAKHHAAALLWLLRSLILARGAWSWLSAVSLPAGPRRAAQSHSREVVRLTLRGWEPSP